MKIQFINALLGGDFSALDIGITVLATCANKSQRHNAEILDLTFHRRHWKEHLHKNIRRFRPEIIGISCNTMYMQYVRRIMAEIKRHYNIPIILGGHHASIYPKETISLKNADYVLTGDAEETLLEFLDCLEKKASLGKVAGLWYKDKGRIKNNGRGCFNRKLDGYPIPDWDLWKDLDKYFYFLGMLYVIGTRGCPYRCTYCDAHGISKALNGPYYRLRNPKEFAREVAYQWRRYEKRGMRLVQLFDQVFTLNKEWLREFSLEYRKHADVRRHKYSAFSRIDNLDEEKIQMLGESGCAILRVGIEAGDPFIRNEVYKKHISNENIRRIFRLCKNAGIGFTAFYILGGPGENRKTINRTIRLARELDAERSAFFIFKPFTSESVELIAQYGGKIDESKWAKADNITYDAVVNLKEISAKEIEGLQKEAYFFTFGVRLLRMLKRKHITYFIQLAAYVSKGLYYGLSIKYLLPYFHIYGYDNVDR